jgi:hypothetical protein
MARWWLTVLLVTLAMAFVAGCGDDDDADNQNDAASSDTTATTGSGGSSAANTGTFTAAELEQFGQDFVNAVAQGDREALTSLLTGVVPQERIDELAACKPADMTVDNVFVSVVVEPPAMRLTGTVDVTQGGDTETKVVNWNTEISEVSEGEYTLSALGSGCPFIFQ